MHGVLCAPAFPILQLTSKHTHQALNTPCKFTVGLTRDQPPVVSVHLQVFVDIDVDWDNVALPGVASAFKTYAVVERNDANNIQDYINKRGMVHFRSLLSSWTFWGSGLVPHSMTNDIY